MPSFRRDDVVEVTSTRPGLQRVRLARLGMAYGLTELVGEVEVGDEVLVNTTAVELGLGTGGHHVIHVNLSSPERSSAGPGHIIKGRYLSEQLDAGSWEEHESFPDGLPSLAGVRVVLCVLHSHVAAVAAGASAHDGDAPAYVMTDQSALPFALSDLAHQLRARGALGLTISAGQAFGAEIEAVNVASGVHAAAVRGHRRIVVAAGPGHVGTASPIGFSAMELAGHAAVLRGLGAEVALAVRASSQDERERHFEISHHTVTLLELTASPIDVPVPASDRAEEMDHSWITQRGHRPAVRAGLDVAGALAELGVDVETMGRRLAADRLALVYLGAAAAWLVDSGG